MFISKRGASFFFLFIKGRKTLLFSTKQAEVIYENRSDYFKELFLPFFDYRAFESKFRITNFVPE